MRFTELLDQLAVPYKADGHEHCRPGWVQIDCPRCTPRSGRYRLGYNLAAGYMNCWSCGPQQTAAVLAELTNRKTGDLRGLLAKVPRSRLDDLPKTGRLKLPVGLGPLADAHRRYLDGRGFDPDAITRLWGLQGIGVAARLGWRLFIPIQTQGQTVSWTTRTIADGYHLAYDPLRGDVCWAALTQAEGVQRYISAGAGEEAVNQKSILYGADYARNAIIIVEGPTDVWAIGPGAVATLGTSYTQAQLATMARYAVRAVCFDSMPDAQARASKLANDLSVFPGETYVVRLSGKDAATSPLEEITQLRQRFLGDRTPSLLWLRAAA